MGEIYEDRTGNRFWKPDNMIILPEPDRLIVSLHNRREALKPDEDSQ